MCRWIGDGGHICTFSLLKMGVSVDDLIYGPKYFKKDWEEARKHIGVSFFQQHQTKAARESFIYNRMVIMNEIILELRTQ